MRGCAVLVKPDTKQKIQIHRYTRNMSMSISNAPPLRHTAWSNRRLDSHVSSRVDKVLCLRGPVQLCKKWAGGEEALLFLCPVPYLHVRDMLISHSATKYTRLFPSWSDPCSDANDVFGTMSFLEFIT